MKRISIGHWLVMMAAIATMGAGTGMFVAAGLGADPYTCMVRGLLEVMGLSQGIVHFGVSLVLGVVMFFWIPRMMGWGTFVSMVVLGFIVDGSSRFYLSLCDNHPTLLLSVLLLVLGMLITCAGVALYVVVNMGIAPYDAMAFLLEEKLPFSYKWCRIATDLLCVAIGFLTGGVIGVGTLVTAICAGPLVSWFQKSMRIMYVKKSRPQEAV